MKIKGYQKLSYKIAAMCVFIAVIICTAICLSGFYQYRNALYKMYNGFAYELAYTAAAYVDGNTVAEYLESGKTDEQYDKMAEDLYKIYKNTNASSIYVCVPDQKTLTIANIYDVRIQEAGESRENPQEYALGVIDPIGTANPQTPVDIYLTGKPSKDYFIRKTSFGYNTSAIIPINNAAGTPTALLSVDVPMLTIKDNLNKYLLYTIGLTIFIVIIFVAVLTSLLQRRVVSPLKLVSDEAAGFIESKNSLSVRLNKVNTRDEIELLAKSVYQMEEDINSYIENLTMITAEKERIGAELYVAKNIQASMLPCIFPAFPERDEFDIYASMTPAKEVGGDFYDFFLVDEDRLALVMADVSGKGVPAALFMVIAKTLIKNSAQTGLSPKQVLEKVNNQLCENNEAEMFVTVWLGIYEISSGRLVAANAGHEYPVMKRRGKEFELVKDRHGFVLAGMENTRYKEYELLLSPGDKLYLYTDGVPEATNAQNELFGTDRMIEALNRSSFSDCATLLKSVHEEINQFAGDAPQFDDITMLCLDIMSKSPVISKKRSLKPDMESMEQAVHFVEDMLTAREVPKKTIIQINTAVDEIYSNIVKYSNAESAVIECTLEEGCIILHFTDNGIPYDPMKKHDPNISLSAKEREIGGLGIYIVKKLMDSVEYEYREGNNNLILKKSYH